MSVLDQKHGGVAPELDHECDVTGPGQLCKARGVLCHNWLRFLDGPDDEWPFDDDPPDPL